MRLFNENSHLSIKTLESLTQSECVGMAKYLYPAFDWKYFKPVYEFQTWEGHIVVAGVFVEPMGYNAVFKIDYREDVNQEEPRIKMSYNCMQPEIPQLQNVMKYLRKIGKII